MKILVLVLFALSYTSLNANASSTVFIETSEADCNFDVGQSLLSHAKDELALVLRKKGLVAIHDESAANYKAYLSLRYQSNCTRFSGANPRMYLSNGGGARFFLYDQNGQTIFETESKAVTIFTTLDGPLRRGLRRILRNIDRELNLEL